MKTTMKTLLLIPFFALLLFTSCQDEVTEISQPQESEALTAESELTGLMFSTSIMDGSADNIIDNASCTSVKLPITVKVNGLEIIIDSREDFKVIEAIFNEFEDDDDRLDIIFPITIILSDHEEIVIESHDALEELIEDCRGENEEDDDIECIDFQYPISFSVFNTDFQIIDVITIENDRQLHRFLKRVRNAEVIASLNFPMTLEYADETTVQVSNNQELARTIKEARNACDEDDDNDYGDDDFTKERLDKYLVTCPWLVHEFRRNDISLSNQYIDYALNFKEDGVVVMRARGGDIVTGTWSTRVTDRGALLKMEFENLADFTLEWIVYDIEDGKIKVFEVGGNKIILKRNCDVIIDITKERIEDYLEECLWRIARLSVNGADNEKEYIGTPLKFYENNIVKLRVNGELVQGTYQIGVRNAGFILQITLEGRPNLKLEWLITFLKEDLIRLENANNKMILERHCPGIDNDLTYVEGVLINGEWEVAAYQVDGENRPEEFFMYTLEFIETGRVKVTDPNNGVFSGAWLSYRKEGLNLGLYFGNNAPFDDLNHRWKIKEITPNRIELKDFNANGEIERILVLEKK
ncbi:MAG: hypothetical protein P8K68_03585 [Algibacter sp.]|uniref:hypothetical protein n=1 Tax=Algibacter sp. TaxID=1872428 RepID=UPI0026230451|nr:hypothetical protein [Algibacter sp.]MDG1730710.1 hypothetical protein [Algibacter sp.]MDG2177855.1 hypothetical protein [Algibacter sp.]